MIIYIENDKNFYKFKEKYKKYYITPVFISILHTLGRNLCFNPHINIILLNSRISHKNKDYIKIDFSSHPSFHKRFIKALLDMLDKVFNDKSLRDLIFHSDQG